MFKYAVPLPPTRQCHDCGKPTSDYRCSKCWEKFRRKYQVKISYLPEEDDDLSFRDLSFLSEGARNLSLFKWGGRFHNKIHR